MLENLDEVCGECENRHHETNVPTRNQQHQSLSLHHLFFLDHLLLISGYL